MAQSKLPDTGDAVTNALIKTAYNDGLAEGRKNILDWLEAKYMGVGRPLRGSEKGEAILELATKAATYIRSLPNA